MRRTIPCLSAEAGAAVWAASLAPPAMASVNIAAVPKATSEILRLGIDKNRSIIVGSSIRSPLQYLRFVRHRSKKSRSSYATYSVNAPKAIRRV
jgi:hypothetical protein